MQNIDHPIRKYRQQHDLSQNKLAERIKISPSMLHHLEYNRGHTTVRRVIKFCRDNHLDPLIFFPDE